jgi:hypothetical protein
MYRRLVLMPVLMVALLLACAQLSDLMPDTKATQSPEALDITATPQSFPTPGSSLPTLPAPIPTSPIPIPTATLPLFPESEPRILGEVTELENFQYRQQPGTPMAMDNIFHPELGCNWMGVGGQVFGESGQPVGMLVVEVGGVLEGEDVTALTLTGSASQWGPAGYEFNLAEIPTLSSGSLWVQLLDLEGHPLSERVHFDTFENCEQAAILVNFVHISTVVVEQIYIPVIYQDFQGG